jgi:hypothetical protein
MAKHIGVVAVSAEGAALCYRSVCVEERRFWVLTLIRKSRSAPIPSLTMCIISTLGNGTR